MLRMMEPIIGYQIAARDGELGKVHDILFDDVSWKTRYFVVDTGGWLPGRQVLISPDVVERPDWSSERLPVSLTKEEVKSAPELATNPPVTLQHLAPLHAYYGWPPWWGADFMPPPVVPEEIEPTRGDPHLRGVREVIDYRIAATDGVFGHLEDLIVDDADWAIRYLIADTKRWFRGKRVLVAPDWIREISWSDREVRVSHSRAQIENSPSFEPGLPVNREYEVRLYDYYGRPVYWNPPPR